jgi:hypothetical protein
MPGRINSVPEDGYEDTKLCPKEDTWKISDLQSTPDSSLATFFLPSALLRYQLTTVNVSLAEYQYGLR